MKKFRKSVMLALTSLFACITLTSCGEFNSFFTDDNSESEEPIDPDKTLIRIGNYYGGLGDQWLDTLCKKYQETHPDVQFKIDNDKNPYLLDNIITTTKKKEHHLFFTEKIYYYDMVTQGLLADITDVVTSQLGDEVDDEGKPVTIESKLDTQFQNYLAYNDVCDDKYYALPTYISHHGLVYDVDLFEQKKLYISKNSTDDNLIFISGTTENSKSLGMDGVANTYDDGLPETFDQFKKLMNEMVKKGVTPFIWAGSSQITRAYFNGMLNSITADYEGKSNFELNFTFDGKTKLYGDTTETTITDANGYEMQRQAGRKYALDFARYMTSDSVNYASSSSLLTSTHLEAQDEYISSSPFQGVDNIKPIAMIVEGDWWENEANINGDFTSVVASKGEDYAYRKRRFSTMPLPKFEGSNETVTYFNQSAQNAFFVNDLMPENEKDIAKDFLKFCHTEMGLQTFTQYTGMMRPFSYELTNEQYNSLTHYSKTLYEAYSDKSASIVHDLSISKIRIQNPSYFIGYWNFTSTVGSNVYDNPANDFINNTNLTAQDYFNGLVTYHKNRWETL